VREASRRADGDDSSSCESLPVLLIVPQCAFRLGRIAVSMTFRRRFVETLCGRAFRPESNSHIEDVVRKVR